MKICTDSDQSQSSMDEFIILNRILLYAIGITFIKHNDAPPPFNYSPFISLINFDDNKVDK